MESESQEFDSMRRGVELQSNVLSTSRHSYTHGGNSPPYLIGREDTNMGYGLRCRRLLRIAVPAHRPS